MLEIMAECYLNTGFDRSLVRVLRSFTVAEWRSHALKEFQ